MADQGQERPSVCPGPSISVLSSSLRQLRAAPGGRVLGWFRAGLQEGRGLSPGEEWKQGSLEPSSGRKEREDRDVPKSSQVVPWKPRNKGLKYWNCFKAKIISE